MKDNLKKVDDLKEEVKLEDKDNPKEEISLEEEVADLRDSMENFEWVLTKAVKSMIQVRTMQQDNDLSIETFGKVMKLMSEEIGSIKMKLEGGEIK